MRDTLPLHPFNIECSIVNLNTSSQPGSHWVCYYRNKNDIIYFDSYGQITPVEIQRYLNTSNEFDRGKEVIQRNELPKSVRRRFDKRTAFAKQVDDIWTADLVDMSSFSRSNKGYKYLLTVIDVFSKYGWIVPLKTKTGIEVAQAFR